MWALGDYTSRGHSACQIPLSLALIICLENMVHNMDMSSLSAVQCHKAPLTPNTRGALTGCEHQGYRSGFEVSMV